MVSTGRTGIDWLNTPRSYDDEFTSQYGSPAIACSDASGECQVMFHTFASLRGSSFVFQRALSFNEDLTHLDSLSTFAETFTRSLGHLGIARFPDGYLTTNVGRLGVSSLLYRFKVGDVAETDPWPVATENTGITARQGVRGAYNHRTGQFRFFWIPE